MRYAFKLLVGKPAGKKLLGRPGVDGRILKWFDDADSTDSGS
jgi:hypothetical protein